MNRDYSAIMTDLTISGSSHCSTRFILVGIRFYQLTISPMLGPVCRYYPTCSNYALEAVGKYGALKGGWLAIQRLLRCHPFRPGGFDPVP